MEGIFTRTGDVNFPTVPRDNNVATVSGMVIGEPEPAKVVFLRKELFDYLKTLTPQERKRLPSRVDPALPNALEIHMKANKVHKYTDEDREI